MIFQRLTGAGFFAVMGALFPLLAADMVTNPQLGLRVPAGFRVTLYAGSELANDIQAMTLDADGNVVVTGKGYIRTLYDSNGDGVADTAREFGLTRTGGMGLCFDGPDLYFAGDGGLWRYEDADGDGVADGQRQRLAAGAVGEHGVHAIRKGPDGWWYFLGGNDAQFGAEHATLPSSPIRSPEAGALLRYAPGFQSSEILAHGFRNPYDFDFTVGGDLFTFDSDAEGDFLLPWYAATRVFHVGYGGHHGWRLNGWKRSWSLPPYYPDTMEVAAAVGRASPTGVATYRHYQFPGFYRNGVFVADWTFGRVLFLQLTAAGATYRADPAPFLEPVGVQGFAPTDLEVGVDGGLLVSIGGRNTRGGVYRVDYVGDPAVSILATQWRGASLNELRAVLNVPEPLAAWSRAYWEPIAQRLGPELFDTVVMDEVSTPWMRTRAVEVLTSIHGGLATATASVGARASEGLVRSRVAWSLGRIPCAGFGPILIGLVRDPEPLVRQAAMDAVASQLERLDVQTVQAAITANVTHPEARLRRSAARLASRLPEPAWQARWNQAKRADDTTRLTIGLAALWRQPGGVIAGEVIGLAAGVLEKSARQDHRTEAIRLIMIALGDWRIQNPVVELYGGYEVASLDAGLRQQASRALPFLKAGLGRQEPVLEVESTRLLAMLAADDAELPGLVLGLVTPTSVYSLDLHHLIVFSRLGAATVSQHSVQVAGGLLGMEAKLGPQRVWGRGNWTPRLMELVRALISRDPALEAAIVAHPLFPQPGHVALVEALSGPYRVKAAEAFLGAVKRERTFPWSGELIGLLSTLPVEETHPLFRSRWGLEGLRRDLLLQLGRKPVGEDRLKYLWGLSSWDPAVVKVSLGALRALPPDPSGQAVPGVVRLLNRAMSEPGAHVKRAELMAFLRWQTGLGFPVQETGTDEESLRRAYAAVFDWVKRQPGGLAQVWGAEGSPGEGEWRLKWRQVNWPGGDARRGEVVYRERGCAACHSEAGALGPALDGVALRMPPGELFDSIVDPSREVAPPYRMQLFHMRDGAVHEGLVAYESAEAVILRTGAAGSVRLAVPLILRREEGGRSLMPEGLLEGATLRELADLYAFLKRP